MKGRLDLDQKPLARRPHADDGGLVVALTADAGVFTSTNGGDTWTSRGLVRDDVQSLHVDAAGTILVGIFGGVASSTDGGANWTTATFTDSYIDNITSLGTQAVYAACTKGIFTSTDEGAHWTALDATGLAAPHVIALSFDTHGVLFAGTFAFGVFLFSTIQGYVADLFSFLFGNVLAIGTIIGRPSTQQTLGNAFRADGLSTMLGGIFNSFPYNAFTQNTGLIALSNVKSRFVVASAGAIMVLMGLFPKLGALIACVPRPVLGGCAIVMSGMTTVAGIQELSRVRFEGTRNAIVVAVSVSVGVLPMSFPALFEHVHGPLKLVLDSGIFLGALTAIVLNLLLNRESAPHTADVASPAAGAELH